MHTRSCVFHLNVILKSTGSIKSKRLKNLQKPPRPYIHLVPEMAIYFSKEEKVFRKPLRLIYPRTNQTQDDTESLYYARVKLT